MELMHLRVELDVWQWRTIAELKRPDTTFSGTFFMPKYQASKSLHDMTNMLPAFPSH